MSIQDFIILLIATTLFGTIMGAYWGTIQYRIIANEPLITSYCFCPSCKTRLSLWHQIPILSWILLGGKCHYCKNPIPIKYPLIEGGFLLFYLISFLLLYQNPILLVCIWILLIAIMLLLRYRKHLHSAIKAFCIFFMYHLIYGGLLILIIYALNS